MAKRPTNAERADVLRALAESAAANGGVPAWSTVAKATGRDRQVLRRWWSADGAEAMAAHAAQPPEPPRPVAPRASFGAVDPLERAREWLTMDPDAFRVEALAELIRERELSESDTAREKLTTRIIETAKSMRPPEPREQASDAAAVDELAASLLDPDQPIATIRRRLLRDRLLLYRQAVRDGSLTAAARLDAEIQALVERFRGATDDGEDLLDHDLLVEDILTAPHEALRDAVLRSADWLRADPAIVAAIAGR